MRKHKFCTMWISDIFITNFKTLQNDENIQNWTRVETYF